VSRPAGGQQGSALKAPRWFHLPPWPRRSPLTLKVHYRGGAEAWVEVHSRGSYGRFPGHTSLIDALEDIWR
jgi:hypothetical protein